MILNSWSVIMVRIIYLIFFFLFVFRRKRSPVLHPGVLRPSQLVSVRSRLVSASPRRPASLFTSDRNACSWSRPRGAQRSPQDTVRVSDCQLRHLAGGRVRALRPRSHHHRLGSASCPWRRRQRVVLVLPAGILLLLRPHAARLEMGLEPGRRDAVRTHQTCTTLIFRSSRSDGAPDLPRFFPV